MSRNKDEDKILRAKKKLKALDLSLIDVNLTVFSDDSLSRYYRNLWAKHFLKTLHKHTGTHIHTHTHTHTHTRMFCLRPDKNV